ncbi:immunity 17 family protein [Pedobacter xixiisoli]|uniref:Immunity protein 17 n=1 Tax=Pedobacter xixiisoli TaxID=1476464 RepID=A0A285ZQ35_9SPHI|nr:immunity 17 family protein [Pedobacter xixiisoli]SOD11738.1 Immunity protein 17 [Pedobacter xixiisoli]
MEGKSQHLETTDPNVFGKILAVVILGFGICLVIGAIKNWNWLYAEYKHYQNNWSMGQISRYLGRKTARIIGFMGGILMLCIGIFLSYYALIIKN